MSRDGSVKVFVAGGGSGNGIKSLINGTCDVAAMSRPMKLQEFRACIDRGVLPVSQVVALDGIAVVVNRRNPVARLSLKQVREVYAGRLRNWRDLGGPDLPIVLYTRESNSGTLEAFKSRVMIEGTGRVAITPRANSMGSNGAMRSIVARTPGAIGFVGLGFTDQVKALRIDGVAVSRETVRSGAYPIARPLFFVSNGAPELGSARWHFLHLHLTDAGQQLVELKGFVPLTDY